MSVLVLSAPAQGGAQLLWVHSASALTGDLVPTELLYETRACPARGMAGLGLLLCHLLRHQLWVQGGRELRRLGQPSWSRWEVEKEWEVSVRLVPVRGSAWAALRQRGGSLLLQ